MSLVRLALEVETIDEIHRLGIPLFFRYTFSNNGHKVGDVEDSIVSTQLLVDLVIVDSVDTDWTLSFLVFKLCFLDQKSDHVINGAGFWCEQVECFLFL